MRCWGWGVRTRGFGVQGCPYGTGGQLRELDGLLQSLSRFVLSPPVTQRLSISYPASYLSGLPACPVGELLTRSVDMAEEDGGNSPSPERPVARKKKIGDMKPPPLKTRKSRGSQGKSATSIAAPQKSGADQRVPKGKYATRKSYEVAMPAEGAAVAFKKLIYTNRNAHGEAILGYASCIFTNPSPLPSLLSSPPHAQRSLVSVRLRISMVLSVIWSNLVVSSSPSDHYDSEDHSVPTLLIQPPFPSCSSHVRPYPQPTPDMLASH